MQPPHFEVDPQNPPYAPGEVIVILQAEPNERITKFIPDNQHAIASEQVPATFGIQSIDEVLSSQKTLGINRVHGIMPESRTDISDDVRALAATMRATYRIRLERDTEVEEVVDALEALPEVAEAYPNYLSFTMTTTPDDTHYGTQWGLTSIRCPEAWDRQKGKSTVVIAVVDTGIDLNHPDLSGKLVPGRDLVHLTDGTMPGDTLTDSWGEVWRVEGDLRTADNLPQDDVGHGTHVAGIVGASSDNNRGVAGVAWHCRLMPIRVMYRLVRLSDGFVGGSGTNANISAGIRWAVDNGADVINLSLGGFGASPDLNAAIQYATAQGVVVVAAMGNHGSNRAAYPAAFSNVISVGAINVSERRATFSATGSHIDVSAPGVAIRSTDWDDTYSNKDGTSMAAPFVAGLAGLILSCNPNLTPAQVGTILRDTAKPLRDNPSDPVPNTNYGAGLIDAKAAIDRACPLVFKRPWMEDIVFTLPERDNIFKRIIDDIPPITTNPATDLINRFPRDPFRTSPTNGDVKLNASDKARGLDKPPISDQVVKPGNLAGREASPFVLSTPHHFEAARQNSHLKLRYEQLFAEAARRMNEGDLSEQEIATIDALYEEYRSL